MDNHYLTNRTKRIRTPSYSRLEQQILLDLIDTHRMVLDCKASDASTNHKKNIAWEEIANQYNNCGGVETVRTVHQLKRCWENMKMRLKNQSLQFGGGGGGGGRSGGMRNDSFIKTDADSFIKNDADSQVEHIIETSSEEKYVVEPVSSTPGRTESDEDMAHVEWLNGYGNQASSIADEMRARLAPVPIKSEGGRSLRRGNQRAGGGGGATLTGIMNKLSTRSSAGSRNNSSQQCASKVLATARSLQALHTTTTSLKRFSPPSHPDQGGGEGGGAEGYDLELDAKRRMMDDTEQQQQQHELYLLNLDEARSRAEEARYRAEEARLRVDEARLRVSNIEREREQREELHALKCKHLEMGGGSCCKVMGGSSNSDDKGVV